MKYLLYTFIVSIFSTALFAQTLDEAVDVLNKPGGETQFKLDKGAEVYAFPDNDGWHKIKRVVYVPISAVIDSSEIMAGVALLDEDGKEIGMAVENLNVEDGRYESGFRKEERFVASVKGYLFKTKFEDDSWPEKRVEELMNIRNVTQREEGLQKLYEEFGFEEREFGEFTAYVMREEQRSSNIENDFRIILIMKGETRPYAVLTKEHKNINPEKIKDEWERGPYRAIYFYKPREDQRQLIQDEILYTFLAL